MMKKLLALLLALAMLLSVSAVFAEGETTATAEPAVEATPVPDTLLVTVNGQEIRENDEQLQEYLSNLLEQIDTSNGDMLRVAQMYAMSYLMQEIMLREKANASGPIDEEALTKTAKEEWAGIVDQFMEGLYGITAESSEEDKTAARADALSYLETNYGYTEDSYVQEVVKGQPLNDAYTALLEEMKASQPDLAATDEDIQKLYEETVAEEMESVGNEASTYEFYKNYYGYQFHYVPEGYRGIIHILLKVDEELITKWQDLAARYEESLIGQDETESTGDAEATEAPAETQEPVTAEMVEAARQAILDSQKATLDEIKAKLDAGTSFEDLIAEYGSDPGMSDENNLKNGYSVHPDSITYDTDFTQAAAALEKVGDISDPVVSKLGIHILKYLRDVPAGALEMSDEEKETLRAEIEDERLQLAFSEYYDAWVAAADVVWTAEGESWKYDQTFINEVQYGTYAEGEAVESGEEAPEAEPAAETAAEPAADTEATPAP